MRRMPFLIPRYRGENFSSGFLHSEFFGAGWAAMPPLHWLLLCLRVIVIEPSFVRGHQSRLEIIWIAPKKFQNLLRRLAPLTFLIAFRHFGTHFSVSFRMSKSSWMMDLTRSREILRCSAIDLAEIRRSSNWINNLRSGHCFGSSRTRRITGGKITTFELGHPVFNGGIRWCMFPECFCQNGVNFLHCLAFAGKKETWWQFASPCCWNRARRLACFLSDSVRRKDLQFGTWTDPSFQRHYRFRPTTSGSSSG